VLAGRLIDLNAAFTAALVEAGDSEPATVADRTLPADMLGFLQAGDEAMAAARRAVQYAVDLKYDLPGAVFGADQLPLRAPVPRPPKIVCTGVNTRTTGISGQIGRPADSRPRPRGWAG
jgi:hypothetical protein